MKVLIVDDEKGQLDYLESKLHKLSFPFENVSKTQSPVDALKMLRANDFDLLFLDVEMPEMTGFELIEILGVDHLPSIIFTTAFSKYAVEAFKVNALDYLLKPVDQSELTRSIERAQEKKEEKRKSVDSLINNLPISDENRLVVVQGQTYLFVHLDDIVRIEGSGSYSDFYLTDGRKLTTSKRLNVYWKRLVENSFLRPHQSHVVNPKYIQGYSKTDGGSLILQFGHSTPISASMRSEIKQFLKV